MRRQVAVRLEHRGVSSNEFALPVAEQLLYVAGSSGDHTVLVE